jgi:hypothetical protein
MTFSPTPDNAAGPQETRSRTSQLSRQRGQRRQRRRNRVAPHAACVLRLAFHPAAIRCSRPSRIQRAILTPTSRKTTGPASPRYNLPYPADLTGDTTSCTIGCPITIFRSPEGQARRGRLAGDLVLIWLAAVPRILRLYRAIGPRDGSSWPNDLPHLLAELPSLRFTARRSCVQRAPALPTLDVGVRRATLRADG